MRVKMLKHCQSKFKKIYGELQKMMQFNLIIKILISKQIISKIKQEGCLEW